MPCSLSRSRRASPQRAFGVRLLAARHPAVCVLPLFTAPITVRDPMLLMRSFKRQSASSASKVWASGVTHLMMRQVFRLALGKFLHEKPTKSYK